ncbi:sulfotransferase family 2 domain-containing protein [Bacillus sp. JJ1521]|uniref:sulfotransferase family 2 domain-containing protein n=1 Tax=Bacillus sp. JJ1521 TaxID=3122957 RepID=UPI002FFFE3B9
MMRIFFITEPERNDNALLFLHIPKTGGQTFGKIIENQYQISEVLKLRRHQTMDELLSRISKEQPTKIGCNVEHLERYLQQTPGGDANISCAYGHMHFGLHRYLSKPFTYATMLRDPVDRVISHYYYFLGKGHFKKETSFEEFITTPKFFNFQTLYLSGGTAPDLDVAKANLNTYFPIVGITELFEESTFLMKKEFGWNDIVYTKKNVTAVRPEKKQISKEITELIIQHNKLDIELYQYARKLLENKIQNLDSVSYQELQMYKKIQQENRG